MSDRIDRFVGEYRFLSNFWPARVRFEGWEYPTSEHAYQASKTLALKERALVQRQPSPGAAKKAGRRVTLRDDWDELKLDIMLRILRRKFADLELKAKLLATGDAELVEGNTWSDTYWGVDFETGKGENHLGELLMRVRDELRKEQGQ